MHVSRPDLRAGARSPALVRFLRSMSRSTAWATPTAQGGGLIMWDEHGTGSSEPIEPATWREASRAGWIGEGKDARWRLTQPGRTVLRRWLTNAPTASPAQNRPRAPKADTPGFNDAECPLIWLSRRKDGRGNPLISETQLRAGEKLSADFVLGHMSPRITANWTAGAVGSPVRAAPGAGVELRDNVAAAQERVRRALAAVGPELAGILLDVCCHQRGLEDFGKAARWPQRTARIVLLIALDSLARHYGLGGHDAGQPSRAIRHWGAPDYRPAITLDDAGEEDF